MRKRSTLTFTNCTLAEHTTFDVLIFLKNKEEQVEGARGLKTLTSIKHLFCACGTSFSVEHVLSCPKEV